MQISHGWERGVLRDQLVSSSVVSSLDTTSPAQDHVRSRDIRASSSNDEPPSRMRNCTYSRHILQALCPYDLSSPQDAASETVLVPADTCLVHRSKSDYWEAGVTRYTRASVGCSLSPWTTLPNAFHFLRLDSKHVSRVAILTSFERYQPWALATRGL